VIEAGEGMTKAGAETMHAVAGVGEGSGAEAEQGERGERKGQSFHVNILC
jgi:hypothetical protein